ncbi:retrovirus-related pol polyprotein from transposon TNT 1-94 [Tanacetum coccineum]
MDTMAKNLIAVGNDNGDMLIESINKGPFKLAAEIIVKDTDGVTDITREHTPDDLSPKQRMMEGTEMTKQEHGLMLYDEFNRFTSEPEESIHSYYLRYVKLINDMNMINMSMSNMQINKKFMNHLQPEWRKSQATGARVVNTFGDAGENQLKIIRCYNCRGEGHIAKQCLTKKRVKYSDDFLANRLVENDDYDDLQLHTTSNFKADHVDAYDSDCEDQAIASAIFMASHSLAGLLNDDTVAPTYDSNTLFEVPHYDTYHYDDVLNFVVQETEYIEHSVSHDDSYAKLTSNINVISYAEYMVTIEDEDAHYFLPPAQDKDMILFVIEQMKSRVLKILQNARYVLRKFDDWITRRTTLSPHEIGLYNEVKEMKDIFKQMKDEVDQCSVEKKCFEIEKKQLLINNDRLLEENISCDIMCTYLRSLNKVDNYGKCKSLDIVILDQQETNKSFFELTKCFAKLKEYCITLELSLQHNKEKMICDQSWRVHDASLINNKYFEINDLKVQLQDKSFVVIELKN